MAKIDFDWQHPLFLAHRPERRAFWQEHCSTEMSEEEYIQGMKALGLPKTSPSMLRSEYKRLKNRFGFFTGNTTN